MEVTKMKTIEFYLIKVHGLNKDYIEKNVVSYGEMRAKDFETGITYQLNDKRTQKSA
jgi:hypothetical protein